jgi:teichuronic acid exporter
LTERKSQSVLDSSLVKGIAWTALLRWLSQIISWVATLYAARLLEPSDYGLVSMAMIAIGLARMVEDFGLDAILVQDRSIIDETQARLAGFLLILGLFLCALFVLIALPVASFFKEPQVAAIIMALSWIFVLDALQVVPRAQLQRELHFKKLALVAFFQVVVTSLILVMAARSGLGHWSLVVNTLSGAAAATVLLIILQPYRILWPRKIGKLTHSLLQGWRLLASRIAWYGYTNSDQTLIGHTLGKDALGVYSFALTFSSLAQQEVGSIISRVVPGIFSEVQQKRDELRRYFLLLTELLTVVTFPLSIGVALTADLLMPLILGPKWDAMIAPLQLLCIYSAFLSSQTLIAHVLTWTGQFRVLMWCSIFSGIATPLALFGAVHYGLIAIGWVWVLFFPLTNIPSFVYAFRAIEISASQWLDVLKPGVIGCAAMSVSVWGLRLVLSDALSPVALAAVCVIGGALVYFLVVWFGFGKRIKALLELVNSVRRRTTLDKLAPAKT